MLHQLGLSVATLFTASSPTRLSEITRDRPDTSPTSSLPKFHTTSRPETKDPLAKHYRIHPGGATLTIPQPSFWGQLEFESCLMRYAGAYGSNISGQEGRLDTERLVELALDIATSDFRDLRVLMPFAKARRKSS
ncbi:hypothetical protein BJ508DRAFT_362703 [Ascobolus immersus RN42]|uniref:Uncharacterized protein n=1 Tax=Ascobolus immersus RN42 TaxID=1160509 RepID=A0A3N4I2K6_ASCIM|nr:hypothetical protein BJ508DRAFT_362703 [Ascobolus immersus RN42]